MNKVYERMMLSLLEADKTIPGPGNPEYKPEKKGSKKGEPHPLLGDIFKEFGGTLDMQKELDKLSIRKLPKDKDRPKGKK